MMTLLPVLTPVVLSSHLLSLQCHPMLLLVPQPRSPSELMDCSGPLQTTKRQYTNFMYYTKCSSIIFLLYCKFINCITHLLDNKYPNTQGTLQLYTT